MKEVKNIELIEKYLSGELSDSESNSFEKLMDADVQLKEEVAFQKDLVSSIQNARRLELKARLAGIDVSAGLTGLQKIGVAASTLLVGSMIYFGVSNYSSEEKQVLVNEETIIENLEEPNEGFSDDVSLPVVEEAVIEKESDLPKEDIKSNLDDAIKNEGVILETASNEIEQQDVSVPFVPFDNEDDVIVKEASEPSSSSYTTMKSLVDKHEIFTHNSNKPGYFYQYNKENINLYGDFSGKEYYLYELKGTGKMYLLFNEKYFELTHTKSKKPLKQIQDLSVIESLKNQN